MGDRDEALDRIVQSLGEESQSEDDILSQIDRVSESDKAIHRRLLKSLAHLDFGVEEAQSHWASLLKHKAVMSKKLGRNTGLRVAMLDYFSRINRQIINPAIIEFAALDDLTASVITDDLTHLYNKRFLGEFLYREVQRAKRYGLDLSLLMLDLDGFKGCNDNFGHPFGDRVLSGVAQVLTDNLREVDFACRYGGEEFAVVFPETSGAATLAAAERVRQRVEETKFYADSAGTDFSITVSGGVSNLGEDAKTAEELVRKADIALYRAKSDGKNRIYLYYKEKRRFVRINAKCEIGFRILTEDEKKESSTKNIGGGGLLFECGEPIPEGSMLELSIRIPDVDHPIQALGKVVRVREKGEGGNDVGLFFVEIDPSDQSAIIEYADEAGSDADSAVSSHLA